MIQIPLETFSYSNQSDTLALANTSVRHSKWNRDSQYFKFTKYVSSECRTVYEVFRHGALNSSGGLCLGWRANHRAPYQWCTYQEVIKRATNFGSGLISMGLTPGSHTMVGIYAPNCPEWVVAEQGVYSYSMILVPLYDSLGPDARSFVISQCEMRQGTGRQTAVHNYHLVLGWSSLMTRTVSPTSSTPPRPASRSSSPSRT